MEAAPVPSPPESEASPPAAILRVQALPFFATIDVFDARFQRVAGTPGAMNTVLEYPVELGVYTVQYKVGESTEKQLALVLEPGLTDIICLTSGMNFTAAAPVHSTLTNCNQESLIAALSLTEPLQIAPEPATASLLLVARELSEGPQNWQSAFADVMLLNWQGEKLLELQQVATLDEAGRYTSLHVALDPGAYRLRSGASPLQEVALYLVEGRQTQVFFTLRSVYGHGSHAKSRRLNLARSSVHVVHPETGFQPASSVAIATEAALRALETNQSVPVEALAQVVDNLADHPMLGLYAARLHLLAPAPSLPLLRQVRDLLVQQLGSWPDVVALAADIAALGTDAADQAALVAMGGVHTLPLLASSWESLLRASSSHSFIIAPDSPAAQLAHTITLSYPTLVWNGQNRPSATKSFSSDSSQAARTPTKSLVTEKAPLNQLVRTQTLAALESIQASFAAAHETTADAQGYRQPSSTWLDAFASKHLHGSDARIFEWVRYNPAKVKELVKSLREPLANETIQVVTEALRLPWHSIQTGIERISTMLASAPPPQAATAVDARHSEGAREDAMPRNEPAQPDEFSVERWYAELDRVIRSGLMPQAVEEESEPLTEPVSYVRQLINLSTDPGRAEYLCQQALNTLTYNWLPQAPGQQAPQIARRLELMEAFRPTTGGALLLNLLLASSPYCVYLDDQQCDTSGGDLHRLALRTLAAYWPSRVDGVGAVLEVPFEVKALKEQYDLYVGLLRSHLTSMEALHPYRRDAVGYLLRLNELTTGDAVLTEMLADKAEGIIPETINLLLSPGRRASLGVNLAAFYQQCRQVSSDALTEFGKVLDGQGYHLSLLTSSVRSNESAESYELPTLLGESLTGRPFWESSIDYGTVMAGTSYEEADVLQRIVQAGPGVHLRLQEWADSTDSYRGSDD